MQGRYKRAVTLAVMLIACPGALMAEDGPVVLERSAPWHVDFADDKCRLTGMFGEGPNAHALFFEQYFPGEGAGMTATGPEFTRFKSLRSTKLRFYDGQASQDTEPFRGEAGSLGAAVIYSSVGIEPKDESRDDELLAGIAELDTQLAARVEYVELEQRGHRVRFATGPLADVFTVMNSCTSGLIDEWGLDTELHKTASRRPVLTNERTIARRIQRVYPSGPLGRGEQVILNVLVIVDVRGEVEDCTIHAATTAKKFGSPACREMRHAQFKPALDANGNPFRSFYTTNIVYRIN